MYVVNFTNGGYFVMKKITPYLSVICAVTVLLTGCNFSLGGNKENNDDHGISRALGIVDYEESKLGIPVDTKDITKEMKNGKYYILHDDVLYPIYTDTYNYDSSIKKEDNYVSKQKFNMYTSKSIVNIPTLFEGDKLLYYNESGILNYYQLERFKDLGWSIGMWNLQSTAAGYVYIDISNEEDYPYILPTLDEVRSNIDTSLLIDKLGGERLTSEYIEDGIIKNLIEGVSYDMEVYNGTNYFYHNVTVDTRFFQSMEIYNEAEYIPLQDYLYEIELPEYLPQGYYNVDNQGMFRYVKGTEYDDETDFNEKLLYEYEDHMAGDWSLSENRVPKPYSSIPSLRQFKAYDEGCFGYDDQVDFMETPEDKNAGKSEEGLANFTAASKTQTDLWLPSGEACEVVVESGEKTGSIYVKMSNGRMVQVPYDRINKFYKVSLDGSGEKVTLIVQGLYKDYQIVLTNAEGYRGQDTASDEPKEDDASKESKEDK